VEDRPVCVVTGASAGIGAATAVGIAGRGYDLALTGRNVERLEAVAQQCRQAGAAARTYAVDASRLAEVRRLSGELLADWPRLDVLVNNAGLAAQSRELTEDGYEQVFAVNHLAPYLLTRLLLDRLVASAPSRVVVVASDAYKFDVLDPDDYHSEQRWQPMKAYGRSKLCNLLFALELQQRLDGTGVAVSTVHPGFVSTSLGRDNRLADLVLRFLRPLIRTPEKGARTSIALATEQLGAAGGAGFHVDGKRKALLPRATDPALARRLWEDSARMVGLDP
jgi:NAD(P)-dependent dehydrogenase (short-subunit alcohol dehydrogenase family)